MAGKASSSQANVGGLGSGALSDVFIQYPPLRCHSPGSRGFYYDDGNKLLISPMSNQLFPWKTAPFSPLAAFVTDSISEGPIRSIRFSLDEKIIAVQRSNILVQFWHRETGETFTHRCKSKSESILGFFSTNCLSCDIVVVKTSGLDLFAYDYSSKSLILVETRKLNVSWYVYTHESRLVLLASGKQSKTFNGFQLSSAGFIQLPKFEMVMTKPEANSKLLLAPEDVYIVTVYGRIYYLQVDRVAMVLHSYRFYRDAIIQQGSFPIYSSKVAVSVVDNVLIVHQVDAKVVILYDIFVDCLAPISAPLPLQLKGFPRSNISMSRPNSKGSECSAASNTNDHEAIIYGDDWTFLAPDFICDVANKLLWKIHLDLEASLAGHTSLFCNVLEMTASFFSFQAISASSSEVLSVLEFLQRRKLEANKAKQLCLAITQTLILERRPVTVVAKSTDVLVTSYSHSLKTGSYFKGIKTEKASSSVPDVSGTVQGIDVFTSRADGLGNPFQHKSSSIVDDESISRPSTYLSSETEDNSSFKPLKISSNDTQLFIGKVDMGTESCITEAQPSSLSSQLPGPSNNPLNASVSDQQESQLSSPAISPDEMYKFVFAPIEEEMVAEPSFLVAFILEFFRSANLEKVKVHPNLYVLTIQLLARGERYAELGLFIINKIIEPSKEVALQLLESGRQNFQIRKRGSDMLRQLSLHHDYVLLLVQDGYYLEALRHTEA